MSTLALFVAVSATLFGKGWIAMHAAKFRVLVGACAFAALVAGARAEDTNSANYLLEACRIFASGATPPQNDIFRPALCIGEMNAMMFFASSVDTPNRACPPKGANVIQATKVVVAYLDAHPERLHDNFLGLAYTALARVWPCPPK
jgi:hypothetical protein